MLTVSLSQVDPERTFGGKGVGLNACSVMEAVVSSGRCKLDVEHGARHVKSYLECLSRNFAVGLNLYCCSVRGTLLGGRPEGQLHLCRKRFY